MFPFPVTFPMEQYTSTCNVAILITVVSQTAIAVTFVFAGRP